MTNNPSASKPKPSVQVVGSPVAKPPRGTIGRPQAKARPGALPLPANREVSAYTKPNVFDRWSDDAAGIRALEIGDNVITMFDVIGEDYWSGGGITAKKVAAQIKAIGPKPIEMQINSPGGDMFEGIAIFNLLREHPQPITVKVMGMAASAASIIAMAGDTIQIGAASFLMIHNCWVLAQGNRHDMRETADWLEPFDQAMVDLYAARTGRDPKEIAKWMDAETYMSGSQAIAYGFADDLLAADSMKTDDDTKARDHRENDARAAVLALMAQGHSRNEARTRVKSLKGMPDAALGDAMPDAGADEWSGLSDLLSTLRSK